MVFSSHLRGFGRDPEMKRAGQSGQPFRINNQVGVEVLRPPGAGVVCPAAEAGAPYTTRGASTREGPTS